MIDFDCVQELSKQLQLPQRPSEEPKPPMLINMHDDICIRTHHLKSQYDLHPEDVEKRMLQLFPLSGHCLPQRPSSAVCRARAARLQELIHFCATNGLSPSGKERWHNAKMIFLNDNDCSHATNGLSPSGEERQHDAKMIFPDNDCTLATNGLSPSGEGRCPDVVMKQMLDFLKRQQLYS
jgi:hypothetical protein